MIVKYPRSVILALWLGLLFVSTPPAVAQSSDQNLPTAVRTDEINGRIVPLDLGDSRSTRRFYAFEGTAGDLLITLKSRNLNGDMDVFTAATFRPLMKITFLATTGGQSITKSVFLHGRQVLILRVEARTPNDDEGSYQIHFGGAFHPFNGGIPVAENNDTSGEDSRAGGQNSNRLSSAGARIEPPPPEPMPAPVEKSAEEVASNPGPPAKTAKTTPPRRRRGARTTRPKPPVPKETPKSEPAKSEAAKTETSDVKTDTPVSPDKPAPEKPPTQEAITPPASAHLIIEEKDGTKIDRPMSTVRRIVVEGGMIVVVLKTGKIERIPMSAVARMAIEP